MTKKLLTTIQRPMPDQPVSWLGGMTPAQFMKKHWQKKPLLVRNAFPDFVPPVSIEEVLGLCRNDLAQSRMVKKSKTKWSLDHGPFEPDQIPSVKKSNWTVLVQQVNTLLPEADRFLDAFRFVPEARLDDLMISVAGPDGGIGAHTDSYDVFLIQAAGKRRWEVATKFSPELEENVPLKILRNFTAEDDWVLEPGDLLYLPPNVAHRGTAVGAGCMTWSVGFRAPGRVALADHAWAVHLDSLPDTDWQDPWLAATAHPGQIPDRLLKALTAQVLASFPKKPAVETAIATVLSEPAPAAVFNPPKRPATPEKFWALAAKKGLRLASPSRLIYRGKQFFMNGENLGLALSKSETKALKNLSDKRQLLAAECAAISQDLSETGGKTRPSQRQHNSTLYRMYLAGWIVYH
ncbi:cupin domain-containing protein [beta proteobacterium MWH-UniP1]